MGVCRGERDEDVARPVAGSGPCPSQPHGSAPREPLSLMWQQRSVGRDHDDDGASVLPNSLPCASDGHVIADLETNGNSPNAQLPAASTVTLHQRSDCIATLRQL